MAAAKLRTLRQGTPSTSVADANAQCIQQLILKNRAITEDEIAIDLNISDGSVHIIISEHLQFRKVCACWVPKLIHRRI